MAEMNFNPNKVPPDDRGPIDPLPPGKYELAVIESSVVAAKSGNGTLLKLTHQVAIGQYENRKLWSQHNYIHTNETAQRIGQREIADLCAAVGHDGPLTNSDDLHDIVFVATVGIERGQDGQDRNTVKRFVAAGNVTPQAQQRPSVTQQTAPAAATAARPAGARPAFLSRGTPGQTAFGR